jgi:transposase
MAKRGLSEASKKRIKAGRLLLAGKGCAEVALAVGVARQTVYTWKRLLDEGGIDALRDVPERGRPAQLDAQQLAAVRAALLQSPTEHGFGTELWTLKRVGALIERLHGVRFGQTNVWRILGSLGFSPQKPEKRAIECNEDAVRSWKRSTWPALKKSPARRSPNCLRRRVREQRAAYLGTHLGTQGPNTRDPVSLQLESCLGDCRTDPNQLPVPPARRQHQEGGDRRIPEGTQGALEGAAVGDLGWTQGPLQSLGAGVPGRLGRTHQNRIPAALCAGPQSGGMSVGLAQTPRPANYCPENLNELHITARNKLKSAQKRPSIIAACWMQATLW